MNTHPRTIDSAPTWAARRVVVSGRVQGVGFRPFVFRLATDFGLNGWVRNGAGRVFIHVEGRPEHIARFEAALIAEAPPLARPQLEASDLELPRGLLDFRILGSETDAQADVHLPPDLFCCDDCVAELQDPAQRRFRYPFTNCTQCGPRYTIINALPYDRPNTSMAGFVLCSRCRGEYENPRDRRFHAQPLACPDCGPRLAFRRDGCEPAEGEAALTATLACLHEGGIVAVKGIGGYHLMCNAADDAAVVRLRVRKRRPHKPLAVMFPQRGVDGLDAMREAVTLTDVEARACVDATRPIVLAQRRTDCRLSMALAPGLAELGVFLPYSPLHYLLLAEFGAPLVATSGNINGEPVITDNAEAQARLAGVADAFLHHDRPIVRPADDSVVRVMAHDPRPVRVGRGLAPREIELAEPLGEPMFAVGGHMKNAIAIGWDRRVIISPHIGELDSPRGVDVFEQVIGDLQALYRVEPQHIMCDVHPGYASTRWALAQDRPVTRVLHHIAHASALAGEYPEIVRWLAFTWDGVGLGYDGELWGGEGFVGAPGGWRRVASLRPFHIVGGDRAAREPWRSAAALMWEAGRAWSPENDRWTLAAQAWAKRIGTSRTSSAGRLFDAAAALVLGLDVASFEGQGPMMLESIAAPGCEAVRLPLARDEDSVLRLDWEPLLPLLSDSGVNAEVRAGILHESLAQALVEQVAALAATEHFDAVGLTGGVFQNRLLAERVITVLTDRGIRAHLPRMVPANDGGLAFGQLIEMQATLKCTSLS